MSTLNLDANMFNDKKEKVEVKVISTATHSLPAGDYYFRTYNATELSNTYGISDIGDWIVLSIVQKTTSGIQHTPNHIVTEEGEEVVLPMAKIVSDNSNKTLTVGYYNPTSEARVVWCDVVLMKINEW